MPGWAQRLRLLASPPWRRAPVRSFSLVELFISMFVTAAVFALAASARPLYAASSGAASLHEDLVKGCAADAGLRVKQFVDLQTDSPASDPNAGSVNFADANIALERAVRGAPGVNAPVVTVFAGNATVEAGGRTDTVQLMSRTGADEHLEVVASVAQSGAWVSQSTAAILGVAPGDTVDVVLPSAKVPITVHGVFVDLVRSRDSSWCSLEQQIVGPVTSSNPPLLILDQATLTAAVQSGGVQPTVAWWEVVPDPARWTVPVAQRAGRVLQRVAGDASNPQTQLGKVLQTPAVSEDPQGSVAHAVEATVTGTATVGPTVIGSICVALLVLADAARTWAVRRRQELRILRMRGAGGWLLACKGVLELGPPIVLGSGAGLAGGYWLVRSYGPSSAIAGSVVRDAATAAGVAMIVALATVALVVGFWRDHDIRRTRRMVGLSIGGVIALVLSAAAYYELQSRGSSIVRSNVGSHVDTLVLLFPTLLIVGVSAMAAQVVLNPRFIRWVSRRMPIGCWLAARRLAKHRRQAMLVVAGTAVAIGSVAFAASVSSTLRATINAKATLGVGATQVVPLIGPDTLAEGSALEKRSTRVLRTSEPTVSAAGHTSSDVIGVDPSTFERAAFWDSSFSTRSLHSLLGTIAGGKTASGAIAVLAVAGQFGDRFSITLPTSAGRTDVRVEVVGRPTAFPGLGYDAKRPLLVVSADALTATGASFNEQLWFAGDDPGLLEEVRAAGLDATVVRRASNLVTGDLQPQLWALGFLKVVGVVSAMVAVSALVLYHAAIGRRRVIGDTVCAYLGMSRRSALVASALESGVMALTGLVVGVGSSWTAVVLVYRHLDTAPEVPPAPLLRLDVAGSALALLAVAVAASVTALVLETRRRRMSLDAVLRNAG